MQNGIDVELLLTLFQEQEAAASLLQKQYDCFLSLLIFVSPCICIALPFLLISSAINPSISLRSSFKPQVCSILMALLVLVFLFECKIVNSEGQLEGKNTEVTVSCQCDT